LRVRVKTTVRAMVEAGETTWRRRAIAGARSYSKD